MAGGDAHGWPRQSWEWLATWCGTGYLPKAPGSWASLAALPPAWLIQVTMGTTALFAAAAVLFAAGLWAAARFLSETDESDPSAIVIDEVAGQFLTLLAVPPTILGYGIGFLLFRFFDIAKPWPIRAIERRVAGAAGVMLDDVAAGVYAWAMLLLLRLLIPLPGTGFP